MKDSNTIPQDPRTITLESEAKARGFTVRWAPVSPPHWVQQRYEDWIRAGRQATMGQLSRVTEVRLNPGHRLGWARSVMVLGAPHAYPDPGHPSDGLRIGRVGRVFWVREQDYIQRLLVPHLEDLKSLCVQLGARCRDYIEQGPLSFRTYGALSGLGWVGRNGMLIDQRVGTYWTLAVLITDLETAFSTAHPQRCGSCHRCEELCPTGALLGDGIVDANRCISYLNTQHPGFISVSEWAKMGNWLYGCDECQEVCPWNHASAQFWQGFHPDPELAHPDLRDIIDSQGGEFSDKYRGSAFERSGQWRLARNALIVLANAGNTEYVAFVRQGARNPSAVVRATAAHAMVKLGDRNGAELLLRDPDELVQTEARRALEET